MNELHIERIPADAGDSNDYQAISLEPESPLPASLAWESDGCGFTCARTAAADGEEVDPIALTQILPVFHGRECIDLRIDAVCAAGEAYFACWCYDDAANRIAAVSLPCATGAYRLRLPEAAHAIQLGLQLDAGARVSVREIAAPKHTFGVYSITMQNHLAASNPATARVYQSLLHDAEAIPETNGSGYYAGDKPKVGIITDDFMYNYYAGALDLVYIEKNRYREILDTEDLSFVLYVSCWRGMLPPDESGAYEYATSAAARFMPELVEYAHAKGLKVVFQSIEDPPNYSTYLPIAKVSDFIFTSAVEMIPKYIEDTGNKRVYYQPYGVNPLINNPIGFLKRREMPLYRDCVFFAGSWYSAFKKRCDDTALLFDSVIAAGKQLIVADRALDYQWRKGRVFPYRYNEYIIPPIEHRLLQKVHKLFDFALNFNSVTDSNTMGAMRVLEVQALGSLLLSNDAKSIRNFYPDMCIVTTPRDAQEYLSGLDERSIVQEQLAGIRRMLGDATVYDRLNLMFARIGFEQVYATQKAFVLYEALTPSIREQFEAQTYRKKELVSLAEFQAMDVRDGYAVLLEDGGHLDEHFLEDAMNAFKFTDVSYVASVPMNDYAHGYDYATGTQTRCNTLYALNRVAPLDLDTLVATKTLDGFTIAL